MNEKDIQKDSYGPVPKDEFRKELEKLDSIKIDLDDDTTVCVDDKMEWLFEWDIQDHDDSANRPA
ncbi:MAG: hypothetical protein AAF363_07665 [Bacteroidota bacterium]